MPRKLKGIRRRRAGWRAMVRVDGKLYTKQFPLLTPVKEMRRWQDDQIAASIPIISPEEARRLRIEQRLRHYRRAWWIYFIQADTQIKIGRTSNVQARLRALQAASPIPLTLRAAVREGAVTERALHQRFAHLRISGEWFRLGPDLQECIESCRAN